MAKHSASWDAAKQSVAFARPAAGWRSTMPYGQGSTGEAIGEFEKTRIDSNLTFLENSAMSFLFLAGIGPLGTPELIIIAILLIIFVAPVVAVVVVLLIMRGKKKAAALPPPITPATPAPHPHSHPSGENHGSGSDK